MTSFNVTQVGLEVWLQNTPNAVITQVGLEVWMSTATGSTAFVATQAGLELWIQTESQIRPYAQILRG